VDAGERRVLTGPRVIDGDTVVDQDVRYRLAGIDAPGVRGGRYGARCEAERMLGRLAAQRVEHLLSGAARAEIKLNGMKDPQRGPMQERLHGLLLVDGRDVGALLLAEGLAQRYEQRRGWCNGL
jgi:endonuclease YncB( thermonuclease family)